MRILYFYCFLATFLLQSQLIASKLTVISPIQLASQFDDEIIPFAIGNYGKVPFGAHFVGGLALADPVDGCNKIEHFLAGDLQFDHGIIALIKKGNCPNKIKTRNAELAGAKMAIIVQDDPDEPLPTVYGTSENIENIHIPTIIISKNHGEKIISFLEKLRYPPVDPEDIIPMVNIVFPYNAKSDKVYVDFWLSSSDPSAYKFLVDFAPYVLQNGQSIQFMPHFVTWTCYLCKQLDYQVPMSEDCVSGGRYCAPDPDDDGPLTGKDLIDEDLRQLCIWRNNPVIWWNYITSYLHFCMNSTDIPKCSSDIFTPVVDPMGTNSISECVKSSYFNSDPNKPVDPEIDDNQIFSEEKELQLEYDITEFPVLMINHKAYNGDLKDASVVFAEICKNLAKPTAQCLKYGMGSGAANSSSGANIGLIIGIIVILSVFAVMVVYSFRRMQRRKLALEISMEANSMVSKYMAVKDVPRKESDDETSG